MRHANLCAATDALLRQGDYQRAHERPPWIDVEFHGVRAALVAAGLAPAEDDGARIRV